MKRRTLIMCDLGGTLADLHSIGLSALSEVLGRVVSDEELMSSVRRSGDPAFSYFFLDRHAMARLVRVDKLQSGVPEILEGYRRIVLSVLAGLSTPHQVLCSLKTAGFTLGIATNGTVESTFAILRALRIREYVADKYILISERFGSLKSAGAIHSYAKRAFAGGMIYGVGDSVTEDLWPASAAGIVPVWVTHYCTSEELLRLPPPETLRIELLSDIPSAIGESERDGPR
jgi:FMN phosphatase YigB (HAD superfamily)